MLENCGRCGAVSLLGNGMCSRCYITIRPKGASAKQASIYWLLEAKQHLLFRKKPCQRCGETFGDAGDTCYNCILDREYERRRSDLRENMYTDERPSEVRKNDFSESDRTGD